MTTPIKIFPPEQKETQKSKRASLQQTHGKHSIVKHFYRKKLVGGRSFQQKFLRYTGERLNWWEVIFRLGGSVVHAVLAWVLLCGAYGFVISLLSNFGYLRIVEQVKVLPHIAVALNVALSLLLAFRTNAAHDRFWEGRKLWGSMVNTVRNLVRGIWITIEEPQPVDRRQKQATMRLVSAFAVAMKLHLRHDPINLNDELLPLMSQTKYQKIQEASHAPLEISFWLGDYLQHQYEREHINIFQLQDLHKLLNDMVDILGACERILKTPVPLAYSITLKLLLIAYLIIIPLELAHSLYLWTGPATAFVSLIFLVIYEVGSEIEEPFGHDPNDLPLDFICDTIKRNVEDLIKHDRRSIPI
jgi:ion channel-forming bestrophin family protein